MSGKAFTTFGVLFILTLFAMLYHHILLVDSRAKKAISMQFKMFENMVPEQAYIFI